MGKRFKLFKSLEGLLNKKTRITKNSAHRVITLVLSLLISISILLPLASYDLDAAASPNVSVSLPSETFIGEDFSFTVSFDNDGTTEGYGPFIDLIFPYNGVDGVFPYDPGFEADGVDYLSATFLGTSLKTTVQQFTDINSGCVLHPYAVDIAGDPIQVCGTEGEKLVTIQLPFGSFVVGQPGVDVQVSASMSDLADEGQTLNIRARGGFQFGETSVNDYATDPSIIPSFGDNFTTPRIFTISKSYVGPEGETATGENFPRSYNLSVDIADGQTLSDFDLIDQLDNTIQYTSFQSANPSGSTLDAEPLTGAPQNSPNNELIVNWSSLTGSTSGNDASASFNFFVPELDADGNSIISSSNGGCVSLPNDISATANWIPNDTRDLPQAVSSDAQPVDETFDACSFVIQKSVSLQNDTTPSGPTPDDTLEYTLSFQVSDYFSIGSLSIEDVLSDGQRFDNSFIPTLELNMNGSVTTGGFDPSYFNVEDYFTGSASPITPIDGTQKITFDIAGELIDRSFSSGGNLLGGCIPIGGGVLDCAGSSGTTGTITFRTIIQQEFTDDYLPQNSNVDQGDILTNTVQIQGEILNNSDLSGSGNSSTEVSSAGITIVNGTLASKQIYAINGVIDTFSTPKIGPGDEVTYKLTFDMPSSDIEELVITDYLPLPVFDATEVVTFSNSLPDSTVPAAGVAEFGPDDTFYGISSIIPGISTNAGLNTLIFDYGSHQTINEQSTTIDILFTVTASDQPFADGLFLTNQAQSEQATTNNNATTATQIVQVELTLPNLTITKGAVNSTNINSVFEPVVTSPTIFDNPPSANCPKFTPNISSSDLDSTPIDSDVSDVDSGDLITFVTVIENTGQGINGAFDIQLADAIPAGMEIPTGGANLCITDGAGNTIPYSAINAGDTNPFFENGIELDDDADGSVGPYHATSGENIAIVTYELEVQDTVEPLDQLINEVTLMNYASSELGPDFTIIDPSDTATVDIRGIEISKQISGTNIADTSGNNVVIGEIIDYQVQITIPEGTTTTTGLVDTLDSGLGFVEITQITADAGLSTDHVGGFSGVLSDAVFDVSGEVVTLPFGTITNSNNDDLDEVVTIDYKVVVRNMSGNDRGQSLRNNADFTWSNGNIFDVAPNVNIQEPTLEVVKTASPDFGDAGDTIQFEILIRHTGASNAKAHEISLIDNIPVGLTYAGNLSYDSGVAPIGGTLQENSGVITAEWDEIDVGQTTTISFDVTIDDGVNIGQDLTNSANIIWSSLDGDITTTQSVHVLDATERTGDTADLGGVQNDYSNSGDGTVSVISLNPTKFVDETSESHTVMLNARERVAIGEVVRYRLETRLAEAEATNMQIRDILPGGLQYMHDGTARIAFVSNGSGITASNLDPLTIGCNTSPVLEFSGNSSNLSSIEPECPIPDSVVSSNSAGTQDNYDNGIDPYFTLGDVENLDRDSDEEYIVIEFNVLVLNVNSNDSGRTINNRFEVRIDGSSVETSSNTNNSRVVIVEPDITIDKSITTAPVDAGDPIVYLLTVTNADNSVNGADAFEIDITDILPSSITFDSLVVSTPNGYTDNSSGNNVSILLDRLNKGEIATVEISAFVNNDTQSGEEIINEASLVYTSLPVTGTSPNLTDSSTPGGTGDTQGERDGSGGVNDYTASSITSTTTLGLLSMDKLAPSRTEYTIGELVTYPILIEMPEGTMSNITLTDYIPDGMIYEDYQIITTSGAYLAENFVGTVPTPTVSGGTSDGEDVELNFATLTATADNVATNNSFVVLIEARVLNVIGNQRGDTLTNTAGIEYDDPNGPGILSDDDLVGENITVIEPILDITKVATSIPSPVESGSVVTYEIIVAHNPLSNSDAYEVVISDLNDAQLQNISNVTISTTGSISVSDYDINGNAIRIPQTGSFTLPNDGSTVTITFDIEVNAGASETIINTADAVWASQSSTNTERRSSQVGDGVYDTSESGTTGLDDYLVEASDSTVSTSDPNIVKEIVATSAVHTSEVSNPVELTIGEEVTFLLRVGIGEGLTSSMQVIDELPDNLSFQSASLVTTAADSYGLFLNDFGGTIDNFVCTGCTVDMAGADLTFDLSNIDNLVDGDGTNNFLAVEIVAKVINDPINDGLPPGQTDLTNTGSARANIPAGTTVVSNTVNMRVVEHNVTIVKEFDTGTNPDSASPFEIVRVDYTLENIGTSNAYDLAFVDDLESVQSGVFNYQSGTLTSSCTSGVTATPVLDDSGDPVVSGTLSELPFGESCTISFDVEVVGTIDGSVYSSISNIASLTDSSTMPGSVIGERTRTTSDSDLLELLIPDLQISKDDGDTIMAPGETKIYDITVTNIGDAEATGVVITDTIPSNTVMDPSQSDADWICAPDYNPGSVCTIEISSVAASEVRIVQMALTADNPMAIGVTQITNTASVIDDGARGIDPTSSNNSSTDTNTVASVVDLEVIVTPDVSETGYNEEILYTLDYENYGTTTATNSTLTILVPAGSTFDPTTSTSGWVCTPDNLEGSTCTFDIGSVVPGGTGVVLFGVMVNDYVDGTINSIPLDVSITDDGSNGADIRPSNNDDSVTIPVYYTNVFDPPSAQKIANADGYPEIEWKMVWINDGNAVAYFVRIVDPIPVDTTYVETSVLCDARGDSITTLCIYDEINNQVVWEGSIAPDIGGTDEDNSLNEVVITFRTSVPPTIQEVENQAHAYWDNNGNDSVDDEIAIGQVPVLSNDPNTPDGGDPTVWNTDMLIQTGSRLLFNIGFGVSLILLVILINFDKQISGLINTDVKTIRFGMKLKTLPKRVKKVSLVVKVRPH